MFYKTNLNHVKRFCLLILMFCFNQNVIAQELNINWSTYGRLPPSSDNATSIGVAAAFTGFIDDKLIVAGGSNFPNGHPFFDKGQKAHHSDVFLFDTSLSKLTKIDHSLLPVNLSSGATVKWQNSLLLIGGVNENGESRQIIQVSVENGKLNIKSFANLPFTWSLGGASVHDGFLYLFAGKVAGQVTNNVWRMALEREDNWRFLKAEKISELPGAGRIQFPYTTTTNSFFLFGGINPNGKFIHANSTSKQYVLVDNYRFDYKKASWVALGSGKAEAAVIAAAGGAALALDEEQIVILGGVNKSVFDDALWQLENATGDALLSFKADYFAKSPEQINFNRASYLYNSSKNSWWRLPELTPFYGGAGPVNIELKDSSLFWISGEIKPAVRQPFIYRGEIKRG